MKQTIVTVKIKLENLKVTQAELIETIQELGNGTGGSDFGYHMWKLGEFVDFEVVKVKEKRV